MLAQSIMHLYSVRGDHLQVIACTYAFDMSFQVRIPQERELASVAVTCMLLRTLSIVHIQDMRLEVVRALKRLAAPVAMNPGILRLGMSTFLSMVEFKVTEICERLCSPMKRPRDVRLVISSVRIRGRTQHCPETLFDG